MSSARTAADRAYNEAFAAGLTHEEAMVKAGAAFERVFRAQQRRRDREKRGSQYAGGTVGVGRDKHELAVSRKAAK